MVAEAYPPRLPHHLGKDETEDGRDDEATEDDAEGELPFGEGDFKRGVDGAEYADEPGGAHPAADGVAPELENAGGEGSYDGARQTGREPDARPAHEGGDLEHTGA